MSDVESDVKKALDIAFEAKRKIDSHEDVCAIRYEGILTVVDDLKDTLKTFSNRMWIAAGSVIGTCLALIIFLAGKIQ